MTDTLIPETTSDEPTLGEILAAVLGHDPAAEQARQNRLTMHGRYVAAWQMSDDLGPMFGVAPGEVFDALCTIPDNMLPLLDTPEGCTALSGYLAADFNIPLVTYRPTIHRGGITMTIDWSLARGPNSFENGWNIGQNAMAAFEHGQEQRRQRDTRKALAAITANPDDQQALSVIMQNAPELGMKFQAQREQQAFNRDLGAYLGGNQNALLGPVAGQRPTQSRPPVPGGLNALAQPALPPVQQGATFDQAFAPVASMGSGNGIVATPEQQAQSDALARHFGMEGVTVDDRTGAAYGADGSPMNRQRQGADLSVLGEPQDGRDRAFLRMLQRDPIKALKIQSTMRENFLDRLKAEREFYGHAVEYLSTVQDDAGWQAALQHLAPLSQEMGTDLLQHVPAKYPGPEGIQQLLERALPIKQQLDHFVQVANIDEDNARADRNTDSLIRDRDARRGEYVRHNQATERNTRRGQDITDARGRRGQDLTKSRAASRGSPREKLPTISTPEQARKLPSGTKFRTPSGQVKIVP